ncbi:MAG TPA: CrcB family protein [Candidatus Nanopelagicaceae bacterium]
MTTLYVILGATVGAPSRFLLDQYLRRFLRYPLGITVVNVLGSFVIGLTVAHHGSVALYVKAGSVTNLQALVAIGFAGAFTTWSTFILDLYLAFELKQYKGAAINLVLSLTLGLTAAWIGLQLVQ